MINYFKRNISLTIGLGLLIFLILFTLHGLLTVEFKQAYPLAVRPKQPPSLKYLFGTDFFGRDLYTAMVIGVWQTAIIGLCRSRRNDHWYRARVHFCLLFRTG